MNDYGKLCWFIDTLVNLVCRIVLWSRSDFDSANQMILIKDNIKLYFYTITDNIAVYTN